MSTPTSTACRLCNSTYLSNPLKKRLIVCCDGTGSGSDKGTSDYSSNVARMSRVIARVGINPEGEKVPQLVYYQSGVGTGSLTAVNKTVQGAFGKSLVEKVCEAYNYLANNFGPGDEVFLFGFSRGAYTARALAGILCQVGLLSPLNLDHFFEIWSAYKDRGIKNFEDTEWAKAPLVAGELGTIPPMKGAEKRDLGSRIDHIRQMTHSCFKIKVVGVWDTVGSLGAAHYFTQPGADTTFLSTKLHPKIENAFHALALDETRGNFPPTLWHLDKDCIGKDGKPIVNLKQVWFPGYHSDVGGHSKGSVDTNSVDEITFSWMIDQLFGLLQISGTALQVYILFRVGKLNLDVSNKQIRDMSAAWSQIAWSDGEFDDTNEWLDGYWITSLIGTGSTSYKRVLGATPVAEIIDGKKQNVEYKRFNEEIHPSVFHRKQTRKYNPGALNGWRREEGKDGKRTQWVKKVGDKEIRLNEYLIPKLGEFKPNMGYDHWQKSLERTWAPKEVIAAQDAIIPP